MKKRIVRAIWAVAVACLALWCLWGNTALTVTSVEVFGERLPRPFDGYRIVQLSDLHDARFGAQNERLIERVAAQQPSAIVLTGDMIDSRRTKVEPTIALAQRLVELAPVCFNDGGAGFSRHGGQPGKRAVCFSGSDVKLVDGVACGKRFLYGVAALEHIFCILRRLLRTADGRAAVVPVPFFLFHSFSSFRCHNNSQYSITASFGNLNPNLTIHRKFTCPPQVLSCKWGMGVIRFVTENSLLKFPTFSQKEGAFFE